MKRRFFAAAVAAAVVGLVAAGSAGAWSEDYVSGQYVAPSTYLGSAYNALVYNEASYQPVGNDVMGLTYCYTNGSCYSVYYATPGQTLVQDYRTISYGAAFCGGKYNNFYNVWVNYCYTATCTSSICA
jgi:hypothetical protein